MESMLSYSMKTDIGTREEQQDYALCINEPNFFAAVVCDGMGGLDGGYAAACNTAECLAEILKKRDKAESISELFLRSVDILDERVCALKNEKGEPAKSGTTVVAVVIENGNLYWLSVGDSRLYLMRGNELVQATRDHNYALVLESLPKEYVPTQEDISKKDALVSFIGVGGVEVMDISNNPVQLVKDDVILLTTDGLFKALTNEQIKSIIINSENSDSAACELLNQAEINSPQIRDNITFVLIKC